MLRMNWQMILMMRKGCSESRAKRRLKASDDKKKKNFMAKRPFKGRDFRISQPYNAPNLTTSVQFKNPFQPQKGVLPDIGTSRGLGPCFQCGKIGHLRRNCPLNTSLKA